MNILAVKLADLGDVLTATPALRALRRSHPTDQITALVSPHSAVALEGNDLVDELITFPKALFDQPWNALRPRALHQASVLLSQLRSRRFDAVLLFHHLTTRVGAAKYALLCAASGASTRAGLDNGRGSFLTYRVIDNGFGAHHEVDYAFAVAKLLGADGEQDH
jgi:heptosyltransferase-2